MNVIIWGALRQLMGLIRGQPTKNSTNSPTVSIRMQVINHGSGSATQNGTKRQPRRDAKFLAGTRKRKKRKRFRK
jgi:hypothetical protein